MLAFIPEAASREYPVTLQTCLRLFGHERQQYGWDAAD